MKAKVRGIYSTALTKLLLDNGFTIVQPSLTVRQRFNLKESLEPPDVRIKDRRDLQGVKVLGKPEAVAALKTILNSHVEDALIREWHVDVGGIYKADVVSEGKDELYVNIGNAIGVLPKSEGLSVKQLVVQVERKGIGKKHPLLTTKLKIIGDYAILAQNGKVGVSLKIHDLNKRAELYALGRELSPSGWGIIWREPSAKQLRGRLEDEVSTLVKKIESLNERAVSAEAPALLVEGLRFVDVEFPSTSKRRLDELRALTTPTLSGHHFYKSCGGRVSAALEMAEGLLEKGRDRAEVEGLFKDQVAYEFPDVGSIVDVEHVKLSGHTLRLGKAMIESLNDEHIRYSRIMQKPGFYNGLDAVKEVGDKAVSEAKFGEWYIITRYFSKRGERKGTYVNLNTPVEVYPNAIRYVDLEVDVCIQASGNVKVLDFDELEKAVRAGVVSGRLLEKVKREVARITELNFISLMAIEG